MDWSPPGFSVHGISQARILEWVDISFSRGSSQPSDPTCPVSLESPALVAGFFANSTTWDLLTVSPFFPGGSHGKEFTCNAGDLGLIPVYCQGWILPPCLFNLYSGLDEAQAGIKIAKRNINNLRCRWHHPYSRKWRTQEPHDESERGEWKSHSLFDDWLS